jgi:ubiquinone/menaquinone biosynthesis C-methylase UbiE
MILDIGCGHDPKGDINLDLYPNATKHRSLDQRREDDYPLNTKAIKNFIVADACYLPFNKNSFDTAYSKDTIEHLKNPMLMIKEMKRISKDQIIVICPTRWTDKIEKRKGYHKTMHQHKFNKTWFQKIAEFLGLKIIRCKYTEWRHFPHMLLPWIRLPIEITFKATKLQK